MCQRSIYFSFDNVGLAISTNSTVILKSYSGWCCVQVSCWLLESSSGALPGGSASTTPSHRVMLLFWEMRCDAKATSIASGRKQKPRLLWFADNKDKSRTTFKPLNFWCYHSLLTRKMWWQERQTFFYQQLLRGDHFREPDIRNMDEFLFFSSIFIGDIETCFIQSFLI